MDFQAYNVLYVSLSFAEYVTIKLHYKSEYICLLRAAFDSLKMSIRPNRLIDIFPVPNLSEIRPG